MSEQNEMPAEIFLSRDFTTYIEQTDFAKYKYISFKEHERICDNIYDAKLKEKDEEIERLKKLTNIEFDGHTGKDVIDRLQEVL